MPIILLSNLVFCNVKVLNYYVYISFFKYFVKSYNSCIFQCFFQCLFLILKSIFPIFGLFHTNQLTSLWRHIIWFSPQWQWIFLNPHTSFENVRWTSRNDFSDQLYKESIARGHGSNEIRCSSLIGYRECNVKIRSLLVKKSFYFTFFFLA